MNKDDMLPMKLTGLLIECNFIHRPCPGELVMNALGSNFFSYYYLKTNNQQSKLVSFDENSQVLIKYSLCSIEMLTFLSDSPL